jgi:uncharacterized DUF497 family protein
MQYEWDEAKRIKTLLKRGVDFADAEKFQWQTAKIIVDERRGYTEQCFVATGFIEERLHVMAFTKRSGAIRIISLRKANKREVKNYEETTD